jgi:ABC-type Zn uptake system ZnuABC Zn-binding protein ZnuA
MGNNSLILPGSNNVAAITAIVEDTSEPTAGNINTLLDAVKADGNTFIFCNRVGKRILNDIGKNEYLQMTPNEFGYSDVIASWNGVPIILD